ncbi:MAG: ABC transporter permease [Gammaproteobacteria bacterium SG8_47]|nr:MAG: ABC transporter permease [Gammaproteobacteria bacterium SG8_47]
MNLITLTPLDLAVAAVLVVTLAATSYRLRLGVERDLIIATARTFIQLLLIGMVLKVLFENTNLLWVSLMAAVMLAAAGREVMVRQQRRFLGWWGYGLGTMSMFISSFTVTLLVLFTIIGAEPWYTPQYAIPLLGMMLGNTMNGVALGLDRLTQSAWQQRAVIESRLMLGDDSNTAIGEIAREATRIGMIPIINAMAAAGIVSLPGMMTGQILAGAPPLEAVKYQILIMCTITIGTGFATIAAVRIGARHLFDERQRLRLDRLRKPAPGA